MQKKKKILFLISDTGGGHRANANAIIDSFNKHYSNQFEFEILDVLVNYSFWPLNKAPKIYSLLSTKYPWVWALLFKSQNFESFTRFFAKLIAKIFYKKLYEKILSYNPNLIVSIHPLVQELTIESIKQTNKKIPFVVICTDLSTAHHLWFNNKVSSIFVVCSESVEYSKKIGICSDNIYNYGLPVREQFTKAFEPKNVLKNKLGLEPNLPAVLVFGGGDGVGNIRQIVSDLNNELFKNNKIIGQVVVICGRNEALKSYLQNIKYNIPITVYGFVNNVAEIMNCCDLVVSKAGPGSIAESLICALPIIIYGFIPGQEEGNVSFVTNADAGFFITDPKHISKKVLNLFLNKSELVVLSKNAKKLSNPDSTKNIVKTLYWNYLK